ARQPSACRSVAWARPTSSAISSRSWCPRALPSSQAPRSTSTAGWAPSCNDRVSLRRSAAAAHPTHMDTLSLARFDRTHTLGSGERVRIRPIRPDDEPRLSELYDRSSHTTRYQRFFAGHRRLPPDCARCLANVDYDRRFALVVEDLEAPTTSVIGVARYEPTDDGVPEIAVVVEDRWQGKGLGTLLLAELFRAAVDNGITQFRA